MNNTESILNHYESCWGRWSVIKQWKPELNSNLPTAFHVVVFPPSKNRAMWTYATCGMSEQPDATAIEIHLFSPCESDLHNELLSAIAHFHLTGEYLGEGHTVNFGRPWLPDSNCDYGLLSLPYLDGPDLEWLSLKSRRIRFLWLLPITKAEVEYKKREGLQELEARFEESQFDYLNPFRKGIV